MGEIRPETEVDRTQAALGAHTIGLPLRDAAVQIEIRDDVVRTRGGQRVLALLVNILSRMKGVVGTIHVVGSSDAPVIAGTSLTGDYELGVHGVLHNFVESLNAANSEYRAHIEFGACEGKAVRIAVGTEVGSGDVVVGCDAWRALFGALANDADWDAANPVGGAMAATLASVEVFKRLLAANGASAMPLAPSDLVYSVFNHAVGADAVSGPDVPTLRLRDIAVAGCGAGGSGTAVVLAMHPSISGTIDLIEPGRHKLSNLNRYLASTASDVHGRRHKLASLVDHLARCAPALTPTVHARPWEQLDAHPWQTVVSAVDTIESRWQIQRRSHSDATIIDLGVDDLLYSVLRVTPGGRCLFCKHPYDPDLDLKQRALRWGVSLDVIRDWTSSERPVDDDMIQSLSRTQGRQREDFADLLGVRFSQTPALLECGSTALRADVPSQAPILPLATTAVAVVGAAEVIKQAVGLPTLDNWLAHDLRRNPAGPWRKHREPIAGCPEHEE